ncbi:MAG: cytochrome P450 [Hyphomicrobiaceae bacterium]
MVSSHDHVRRILSIDARTFRTGMPRFDPPNGVTIRKGTILNVVPYVMHRHENLWRDPNAFRPERFAPSSNPIPRGSFMPFRVGPRTCIGAAFAMIEGIVLLAMFARAARLPIAPVEGDMNGLRIGTPELVRWGVKEKHTAKLASLIARAMITSAPETLAAEVRDFRQEFQELHFICT